VELVNLNVYSHGRGRWKDRSISFNDLIEDGQGSHVISALIVLNGK